jgi:XTP/dITP diphosphohydrolase
VYLQTKVHLLPKIRKVEMTQKLLIATHNQGKLREYQTLLADLPLVVTSLQLEKVTYDVEETGTTFAENAILKATEYAQLTGLLTWADDSGLEVDPLAGRPGVYSARYGGPGLTDEQRYQKVLAELLPLPKPWTARFRCVVALVTPAGQLMTVDASVEGLIIEEPRGAYGFGYDPIFFLPEFQCTMAELTPAQKNEISHRGKAAAQARQILPNLLD